MGPTMRVLSRWVREFAAGVDAGHAIRLGLPVSGDALRDGIVRDAARPGYARAQTPAGAAQPAAQPAAASRCRRLVHAPAPKAVAATPVPGRYGRIPTSRGRAQA